MCTLDNNIFGGVLKGKIYKTDTSRTRFGIVHLDTSTYYEKVIKKADRDSTTIPILKRLPTNISEFENGSFSDINEDSVSYQKQDFVRSDCLWRRSQIEELLSHVHAISICTRDKVT